MNFIVAIIWRRKSGSGSMRWGIPIGYELKEDRIIDPLTESICNCTGADKSRRIK
jgi:hypothetical protein